MAGHAQLKFVMTECSKTQISLTGLKWYFVVIAGIGNPMENVWGERLGQVYTKWRGIVIVFCIFIIQQWAVKFCHKSIEFLVLLYIYFINYMYFLIDEIISLIDT